MMKKIRFPESFKTKRELLWYIKGLKHAKKTGKCKIKGCKNTTVGTLCWSCHIKDPLTKGIYRKPKKFKHIIKHLMKLEGMTLEEAQIWADYGRKPLGTYKVLRK